jgi:DNA-directed RNA polymerase subunit RPC12/RpoP
MAKKVTGAVFERLFENVFVCLKCKSKQRANPIKVRLRKILCRNCKSRAFRPKSKMGKR